MEHEVHDQDYYRRRERSARDLAERTGDPTIRRIHSEMAERYAALARGETVPSIMASPTRTGA